jgi:hypothetical protein
MASQGHFPRTFAYQNAFAENSAMKYSCFFCFVLEVIRKNRSFLSYKTLKSVFYDSGGFVPGLVWRSKVGMFWVF